MEWKRVEKEIHIHVEIYFLESSSISDQLKDGLFLALCWDNSYSLRHYNIMVYHVSAASISPGNLLDMQILKPLTRPTESDTLGWGSPVYVLINCPRDCDACSSLGTTILHICCCK